MKNITLTNCGIFLAILVLFGTVNSQTENAAGDKIIKEVSKQTNGSELIDFSGEGTDEIFPSEEVWQPFGPYREITVENGQKIVGFGSAVFGMSSGKSTVAISLCYIAVGNRVLTPFLGDKHLVADVDTARRTFSVSASGALPAGTYSVGYCVINRGSRSIDNNDYVNGWMLVIN